MKRYLISLNDHTYFVQDIRKGDPGHKKNRVTKILFPVAQTLQTKTCNSESCPGELLTTFSPPG